MSGCASAAEFGKVHRVRFEGRASEREARVVLSFSSSFGRFTEDSKEVDTKRAVGEMSAQEEEYYESNLPRSVKIAAEQFEIEEDTSESGRRGGGAIGEVFRRSSHPGVSLFYIGFKLAAIAAYLLLGFLLHNFVIQFVTTVTLLAFDFWMTKNISGRLLVGLRWWTDVQDDGSTTWRFECIEVSCAAPKTSHHNVEVCESEPESFPVSPHNRTAPV